MHTQNLTEQFTGEDACANVFQTYAEVEFMLAESAFRWEDWRVEMSNLIIMQELPQQ
jgi:hypothetical protein